MNFCMGMAAFGGTTPMILTHCIESLHFSLYAPALYPMAISVVFSIIYFIFGRNRENYMKTNDYVEQLV